MNIFVTDASPFYCATHLDDKRVVKMVLETAQMLSTVTGGPYKPTHASHPCTLWVGTSCNNYVWTYGLMRQLCAEYKYRYGRIHKCESLLPMFSAFDYWNLPKAGLTQWANCSGFELGSIFLSYRECLNFKWLNDSRDPTWTRRGAPSWSLVQ